MIPREHIARALGGPAINTIFFGVAALLLPLTKTKSIARDVVNAALGMNVFLILGGLLPFPGIDGGAALNWVLVENGQTPSQADESIRKVDAVTGAGLVAGAIFALTKRKRLLADFFTMFAGLAFVIATGLLKEKE